MLVKHSLFYYHQFRRSSKFWIKGDNMQLALWVFCVCLNKEVIINGTPFLFEFINACVIHEYHLLFFFFCSCGGSFCHVSFEFDGLVFGLVSNQGA